MASVSVSNSPFVSLESKGTATVFLVLYSCSGSSSLRCSSWVCAGCTCRTSGDGTARKVLVLNAGMTDIEEMRVSFSEGYTGTSHRKFELMGVFESNLTFPLNFEPLRLREYLTKIRVVYDYYLRMRTLVNVRFICTLMV